MNSNRTVRLYKDGATTDVIKSAAPVWLERGWSENIPATTDTSLDLRTRNPLTQASDVTAPGESEVEGHAPNPEHAAQDEE